MWKKLDEMEARFYGVNLHLSHVHNALVNKSP